MADIAVTERSNRWPSILSLLLILAYPILVKPLADRLVAVTQVSSQITIDLIHESLGWLYVGLVLAILLVWERRPIGSIGLRRPGWRTIGFGLGGAVLCLLVGQLVGAAVNWFFPPVGPAGAAAAAMTHGSVAYAVAVAIRAGAIEELFYRGIAIEQLSSFVGSRWVAALLAGAIFILAHALVFDWPQLIPIGALTVVLTVLYLWRGDLWANILAHILVDTVGLLAVTLQPHP
jgi:uncharacterized protein